MERETPPLGGIFPEAFPGQQTAGQSFHLLARKEVGYHGASLAPDRDRSLPGWRVRRDHLLSLSPNTNVRNVPNFTKQIINLFVYPLGAFQNVRVDEQRKAFKRAVP